MTHSHSLRLVASVVLMSLFVLAAIIFMLSNKGFMNYVVKQKTKRAIKAYSLALNERNSRKICDLRLHVSRLKEVLLTRKIELAKGK